MYPSSDAPFYIMNLAMEQIMLGVRSCQHGSLISHVLRGREVGTLMFVLLPFRPWLGLLDSWFVVSSMPHPSLADGLMDVFGADCTADGWPIRKMARRKVGKYEARRQNQPRLDCVCESDGQHTLSSLSFHPGLTASPPTRRTRTPTHSLCHHFIFSSFSILRCHSSTSTSSHVNE